MWPHFLFYFFWPPLLVPIIPGVHLQILITSFAGNLIFLTLTLSKSLSATVVTPAFVQGYTGAKEDLGNVEQFYFEILHIPRLKPRLQARTGPLAPQLVFAEL